MESNRIARAEVTGPRSPIAGALDRFLDLAVLPGFSSIGYEVRRRTLGWDPPKVRGRTVMVTGANAGLGRATSETLAEGGARVVMVCRDREKGEEARQAVASVALLEPELLVADLVNNAGVMLLGPILDADPADWERMISVNVDGLLACTHAALPHLLRAAQESDRQVADVVNLSSTAGRFPRVGSGVYNLAKHGIGAFSESLRQEVTARSVRVSLVEPGAVATELIDHLSPQALEGFWARFDGVERLLAEDVADVISFIVTRPRRVAVNEVLMRPTDQEA